MMVREFTERTKYNPTTEEYHYIEESYYDFEGTDKDEFCKQWLKDKKTGKWALEYRLRKSLDEQKEMYEEQLKEKEEMLQWYREQYEELQKYRNMVRGIKEIVK